MSDAPAIGRGLPAKQIAAVVVGNALEFYDFLTYSFFAVQIGHTFFPDYSPTARLLLSLGTFAAGFLTRPLGGWIIGGLGDRHGRKPAMILSFALMGIALFGLALTPSYRSIGVAAPIIALAFRMVQGFALGGNVGPTTAYLIEAAPPGKRGFYASLSFASQDFSVLVAGVVGVSLATLLTPDHFADYGWRIAFLLGASIVPFGLMLRRTLEETHVPAPADAAPISLWPYLPVALFGLVMLASATISNYVVDYMTTYAGNTLHMNTKIAFGATVVIGLFQVSADLASGWLSDRYGRKPVMIVPTALMMLLSVPAFFVIAHFRSSAALFGCTAVLAALQGLGSSPVLIWITESIPPRIRSGAVSVIYAVSIALFGGTTQVTITWLIGPAQSRPLAPAWYMAVALAAGLCAMFFIRETAPRRR